MPPASITQASTRGTLPHCFLPFLLLKTPKEESCRGSSPAGMWDWDTRAPGGYGKGPRAALPCPALPPNHPNVHPESPGDAGWPRWCQLGDSRLAAACCQQHLAGGRHAGWPRHRNRSIPPKVSPEVTRGWSTAPGQSVCKKSRGHKTRCESK